MCVRCAAIFVVRRIPWIFSSSKFSHVSWTHIFKCLLAWIWSFDHGLYLKRNLFNGIIFVVLIFWGYWVFWALGLNNYRHNYSFHQYFNPDFVEDDHCGFWYLMPICLIVLIPCYGCGALPINQLQFLFIDDFFKWNPWFLLDFELIVWLSKFEF